MFLLPFSIWHILQSKTINKNISFTSFLIISLFSFVIQYHHYFVVYLFSIEKLPSFKFQWKLTDEPAKSMLLYSYFIKYNN